MYCDLKLLVACFASWPPPAHECLSEQTAHIEACPCATVAERALVKSIVATLSIKRISDQEIVNEVFNQTNKTLSITTQCKAVNTKHGPTQPNPITIFAPAIVL